MKPNSIFDSRELASMRHRLDQEAQSYKFETSEWLELQRADVSQFGAETRKFPEPKILKAVGLLIWACAQYEEKVRQAVFWLQCYVDKRIVDLPGQKGGLSNNLKNLHKLLAKPEVAKIIGPKGIKFIEDSRIKAEQSINHRHDIVHGHHLGGWAPNTVFRARGLIFDENQAYQVELTPEQIEEHAETVLKSAAILSLLDDYFDAAYNGR